MRVLGPLCFFWQKSASSEGEGVTTLQPHTSISLLRITSSADRGARPRVAVGHTANTRQGRPRVSRCRPAHTLHVLRDISHGAAKPPLAFSVSTWHLSSRSIRRRCALPVVEWPEPPSYLVLEASRLRFRATARFFSILLREFLITFLRSYDVYPPPGHALYSRSRWEPPEWWRRPPSTPCT